MEWENEESSLWMELFRVFLFFSVALHCLIHHLLKNSILFKGIDLTKYLWRNLGNKVSMVSRGVGKYVVIIRHNVIICFKILFLPS